MDGAFVGWKINADAAIIATLQTIAVALQAMLTATMALIPFAFERAESWRTKSAVFAGGTALLRRLACRSKIASKASRCDFFS